MDLLEGLELLGYFAAFWSFALSRRTRAAVLERFRAAGVGGRCSLAMHATMSLAVGLALPLSLVWFTAA